MPTATLPTLSEDQIEDILYLARTGETHDLLASIEFIAKTLSTPTSTILTAAVDPDTGNGLLHMASANGHADTLNALLAPPSSSLNLDLQNASGNTPLHWAALNGHLSAVQALVKAGADVTVINGAGHDAVYAAEANEKNEVAEWLLKEGKGLETGVSGRRGDGGTEAEGEGEREGEGEEGRLEEDVVMKEGEEGDAEEGVPPP